MLTSTPPMEELFDTLRQMQAAKAAVPAIPDMVREWKGMGENMLKSLVDCVSDMERRERKLGAVRESLEGRVKDLEKRERELEFLEVGKWRVLGLREGLLCPMCEDSKEGVEMREKKLDAQLKLVEEHIESLEAAQSEVHGLRLLECEKLKEIKKRENEVGSTAWSLEKRLREIEQREKEFNLFRDEKSRELALDEELLSKKREDMVEEFRLVNEKLRERQKLGLCVIQRLDSALSMLEGMKVVADEKFKEIKSWETGAHKSLITILNEADLIRESLERRFRECEEMEREFNMLQEDKMLLLESKERQLSMMRTKFLKEIKLRDEKLIKRFKEIESWETQARKTLTVSLSEADLFQESLEKRFKEFEEMEKEFNILHEDKMQKLELKERQLKITITQLLNKVKLKDEKLTEKQKLGHQLLVSLQEVLVENLKEIESREESLNVACETLDARAKDDDLLRESANKRLKEIEKGEREFQLYQEIKMRELVLADEEKLRLIGKEFIQEIMLSEEKYDMQDEMMHGLLKRLELAEENVKGMNTLVSERFKEMGSKEIGTNHTRDWIERKMDELEFKSKGMKEQEKGIKLEDDVAVSEEKDLEGKKKELEFSELSLGSWRKDGECNEPHLKDLMENLELKKLDQPEKYLVENPAGYLSEEDQQRECSPRGVDLKGNQNGFLVDCDYKQSQLSDALDARSRIEPDLLKRAVHMDGKSLELIINNAEKDLELIGAEVFKVLFLSSDPAKLVLDTIEGFYIPHLGKGDIEVNMRRKNIILLDQLTKMSPSIQPCVREAAIKLANEWRSKMCIAENSLEVLGFLHFLAAYNLSSCFDKDELLSFLNMVAHHKQTPELCRILGLSENISGFIQNLINEKQYLFASTYIHECGLENMFPQAAVLNYYVQHSKAKRRRECTSPEAQDKAIASEIADLRVAIDHIIKYGLELEYSPEILTARIKQLERTGTSLRNGTPLSTNVQKQEKSKRFVQPRFASKKKTQGKQERAAAKNLASPDISFLEPLLQRHQETKPPQLKKPVNEIPTVHSNSTSKRRRITREWGTRRKCAPSTISS